MKENHSEPKKAFQLIPAGTTPLADDHVQGAGSHWPSTYTACMEGLSGAPLSSKSTWRAAR
jgi:hypothetical protein